MKTMLRQFWNTSQFFFGSRIPVIWLCIVFKWIRCYVYFENKHVAMSISKMNKLLCLLCKRILALSFFFFGGDFGIRRYVNFGNKYIAMSILKMKTVIIYFGNEYETMTILKMNTKLWLFWKWIRNYGFF